MSAEHTQGLSLEPLPTNRNITVPDATTLIVRGVLHDAVVKFGSARIPLEFLVVDKSPFHVIIGCLTLEKLDACIDSATE